MFDPVESNVSFPRMEEEISRFWKDHAIYEKSLTARAGAPAFVFYEGPPTANGIPHPGHCLTRAIKDLYPRYRTMRGYRCLRKAGWDTHGLPVEVEVCKELGIHSKEEIESFGMEPFINKCLQSVFRYTKEWEQLTERLGFWINLDEAYVTYHQSYVESVWWALKSLFDRGLLYQEHKIVWWWPQGGTALSSGEVGQGYREVTDPSVYVRFPLVVPRGHRRYESLKDADLLVWTTTPWTLPSNQFAAVKPDLQYAVASVEGESRRVIVARDLLATIADSAGRKLKEERVYSGHDLLGLRYLPPFDCFHSKLGAAKPSLYRPKEGERWADYPGLYAVRLVESVGLDDAKRKAVVDEWLRQNPTRPVGWHVVAGDFVTTETGTGIVHIAPAFGEDDFEVLKRERQLFGPDGVMPPLLCPVAPNGNFTDEVPDYHGRFVFDCNKDIVRYLDARRLLFHQEQYLHDYPFCWRADEDRLIQYPRKSWFIRTTKFKDQMLANNAKINWLPEHIRDGRFGDFLKTNVDWALSRERYWGTPLPIWVCEETGYAEAVASYDEVLAKPGVQGTEVWLQTKQAHPELPEHLKVHKPYIDAVTYDSPKAPGKRMRRVSEVIDCWFDSGSMPFAQWGYPHVAGSDERLKQQFPADFISEALDQTRGWFYSQLAISTLLFGREPLGLDEMMSSPDKERLVQMLVEGRNDPVAQTRNAEALSKPTERTHPFPHPFRNCVVLGLMLGEDGAKMSKSKRNYREPQEIFDRYGADALRWYFFSNQPPWTSIRYSETAIKESIPEFLLRLWNVYSFFVIYAGIDGFDPAAAKGFRPSSERSELDRWILSELNRATAAVIEAMDAYDNFTACGRITEFVDGLSNWYVRRSRDRFWQSGWSADKADAYWTLYECLLATTKLIAPFVPFMAEAIWQNLAVKGGTDLKSVLPTARAVAQSVHLCDYPTPEPAAIDEQLSAEMALVREIVSLGHNARMGAKLKVRQPLDLVEIVLADPAHKEWLADHAALIRKELNVKRVEFAAKADHYVTYSVLPDLKRLGPRFGKRLPALRQVLAQSDASRILAALSAEGKATLTLADGPVTLDAEDLQVRMNAKEGWAAAQGRSSVVVVSTDLTPELVSEGLAREVVHAIQNCRKEMNCQYTDRIRVAVVTASAELHAAVGSHAEYIRQETLSVDLTCTLRPVETTTGGGTEVPPPVAEYHREGVLPRELTIAGHAAALDIRVAEAASVD